MFNQSQCFKGSMTPGRSRIPISHNRAYMTPKSSNPSRRLFSMNNQSTNLPTRRRSLSYDSAHKNRTPGAPYRHDIEEFARVSKNSLPIIRNTMDQARSLNQHFQVDVSHILISSLTQPAKFKQDYLLDFLCKLGESFGLELSISPEVADTIAGTANKTRLDPNLYLRRHAQKLGLIELFKKLNADEFNFTDSTVTELLLSSKVPKEITLFTVLAFLTHRKKELDQLMIKMSRSNAPPTLPLTSNHDYNSILDRVLRIKAKQAFFKDNMEELLILRKESSTLNGDAGECDF